jgi:hypothetical protein
MLRCFFVLIGFVGVLGCFRLSTDFHGCARILFGGFWIVIGEDWPRICGNARELFKGQGKRERKGARAES